MADGGHAERARLVVVATLFFVSGAPALVYQLLWQRALFAVYGIHVESVAVVVAAFLLGLGLGGLAGGLVSRWVRRPLVLFGAAEVAVGLYGWGSLALFERVGAATLHWPFVWTAVCSFMLVLLPTALMGATLPLLTAHLVRTSPNVGRAVGLLAFVNTLGSAAACLIGAFFLFDALGASGSVRVAAAVNVIVGVAALGWGVRESPAPRRAAGGEAAPGPRGGRFTAALLLAAFCGAVSLSYEVVWVRVFSFATGGHAAGFAFVLAMFLVGLAVGALLVRGACRDEGAVWGTLSWLLAVSAVVAFAVVPGVARLAQHGPVVAALPFVVVGAAFLGAALPLLAHLGVRPDRGAGAGVGALVLANIVGAATGSLITGFFLMERFPIAAITFGLAGAGLAVAVLVRVTTAPGRRERVVAVAGGVGVVLALAVVRPALFDRLWERLLLAAPLPEEPVLARVVEGRAGVLAVSRGGVVYGGGVYDGAFSIDLVDDRNGIARAYALGAFHAAPRDVLVIGLSSGSWARVIAAHPAVERLTIVEIDRGYLELFDRDGPESRLLDDPRVSLEIDDGRRWLARHPDRRFDAIVMNTTFHWRSYASRLLSVEFLERVRRHLKPGGVVYYNTTASPRAQATAAAVFPHVFRLGSFVGASDAPIVFDRARWRHLLTSSAIEGRPVLDLSKPRHAARLEEVLSLLDGIEADDVLRARTAGATPITDDDMGSEWSHGPDR